VSTPSPYSRDPVDELVLPVAARPGLPSAGAETWIRISGREGKGRTGLPVLGVQGDGKMNRSSGYAMSS